MIKKVFSPMLAAAALALSISGSASAQMVSDQRTYFTFSAPVALPGVTLPAGKYTFRLANSQTNRHIVQVFNADGTKIFATLLAIPSERREIPSDPEIQFRETPSNTPPAIGVWYYPGTKTGHEFLYSKNESAKWAAAKGDAVQITTKGVLAPNNMTFSNSDVAAADIAAAEAAVNAPVTPAPEMRQPPAPVAAAVRPDTSVADSRPSMNARAERSALPNTASSLPLVGTIGVLSLLAGVAIFSLRRRAQA